MKTPIVLLAALTSSVLDIPARADVDSTLARVAPPAPLEVVVAASPPGALVDAPAPSALSPARPSDREGADEARRSREELADWLAHYAPYLDRRVADAAPAPVR